MHFRKLLFLTGLFFLLLFSCDRRETGETSISGSDPDMTYKGYDQEYVLISSGNTLQDKLFYFFTILQNSKYERISALTELKALHQRYSTLFKELKELNSISKAKRKEFLINKSEANSVVTGFFNAYRSDSILRNLVINELRPSGYWQIYANSSDEVFFKMVVSQTIAAVDTIISQYLVGTLPKYYEMDGPIKDLYTDRYEQAFKYAINNMDVNNTAMFYLPVVTALTLLKINNRDEAARFEPLNNGENKFALSNLNNIAWDDFQYTCLILPGDSPNLPGDAINLSESAKNRIGYAVQAFNEKLAPLIIISGANVYPKGTSYFEAVEMKKYMMQQYSIPENVILIDPHARHTTTNLRNAVRLIIRNNIPCKSKALIVSIVSQIDYIASTDFYHRCFNDLGYMPGTIGSRLSPSRLEFTPDKKSSLHISEADPLDP